MAAKKPAPKVTKEVCTLCGLDWDKHGDSPTTDTCVELLLGEIRSLNAQLAHRPLIGRPIIQPIYPYPNPYVPPVPSRPYWGTTTGTNSMQAQTALGIGRLPQPRNGLQ